MIDSEKIIWEDNKFYVTWFPSGSRWLLYVKGQKYSQAECLSRKVWTQEYKSNPEIFCQRVVEKRIKGILSHMNKLRGQIDQLNEELKMLVI